MRKDNHSLDSLHINITVGVVCFRNSFLDMGLVSIEVTVKRAEHNPSSRFNLVPFYHIAMRRERLKRTVRMNASKQLVDHVDPEH